MFRFNTLKDLYDKLNEIELLKNKIQLNDDRIEIVFHDDYILSIELKIYYSILINDILCCKNIEDQDIWEIIYYYINEDTILIEFDNYQGKRKIREVDRKKFERIKDKLVNKHNVKIYTSKKSIL